MRVTKPVLRYVMARPKRYETPAEKQRAYRQRRAGVVRQNEPVEVPLVRQDVEMPNEEISLPRPKAKVVRLADGPVVRPKASTDAGQVWAGCFRIR